MSARLVVTLAFVAAVCAPCTSSERLGQGEMVLRIALRHFPTGGLVVVFEDAAGPDAVSNAILEAGRWPVMTLSSLYRAPGRLWLLRSRAACFVLVGAERSITDVLGRLRNDVQTWWNSTALFLLVLQQPDDLADMHHWMLRAQATNVVLAVDAETESGLSSGEVSLLSVLPPKEFVCKRHSEKPTRVDTWIAGNSTFLNAQAQLFAPRRPEDCARCEVLVARAEPPAMYSAEGRTYEEVFHTIMRHLGCALSVTELPSGLDDIVPLDERDRLPGAYDRTIRGQADVVLRYVLPRGPNVKLEGQ